MSDSANIPTTSQASPPTSDPAPSEDHHQHHEHHVSAPIKWVNLIFVIVPFLALITAIILVWGWGFSWVHLGLLLGMYAFTTLGIGVGYHRLLTHRAFETTPFMKALLSIAGSMAVEAPVLKWVATHRRHHQHSDEEGDPHSPHLHGEGFKGLLKGFWHAHLGWVFLPDPPDMMVLAQDLQNDRVLQRVDKLFPLWCALGMILPGLLGWAITGTWRGLLLGFIWGGLVRIFLVHHVTFSINSVCHTWGSRPFRVDDHSTNNLIFGVLAFGEGWHNNHHAFPTSARHGLKWWQIDVSYYMVRCMSWVGLAWKVKLPGKLALESKRKAPAGA